MTLSQKLSMLTDFNRLEKAVGFPMFSGGIKVERWLKMG